MGLEFKHFWRSLNVAVSEDDTGLLDNVTNSPLSFSVHSTAVMLEIVAAFTVPSTCGPLGSRQLNIVQFAFPTYGRAHIRKIFSQTFFPQEFLTFL